MSDYRLSVEAEGPAQLPSPKRVLTIGAHPDDAEFGAGGTLAKWARAGCDVTMLIVTDGSKGTWDPDVDPQNLIAARRAEQRTAADAIGAGEVIHLDYVDGELEYTMGLRREMAHWIRRTRPDVVLAHDPWRRYMLHPDHRAAGWGAVDGLVAARDHLFFPEQLTDGLSHHRPDCMLLWAADEPDHHEDITATIDAKIEALLCHSSQGTTTMDGADTTITARAQFAAKIRERAAVNAAGTGFSMAEAFKRIEP
ncbi:MAG: PIG-L family deacetylase [Acidimicrobiia bacterium]|nr:PIG-L family deacetylase [Acidimicrobiia bacterium]